ncbi:prolyl oligopeptidase family serine peptidase [Streptomyces sp. NBC_00963]|uniref:LpqB family beta-propeller domain-containing protein n=1 Tax=unclassified Streptomyces TaxID=2593676 RepID=UPI00224F4375|nr:prolyl oligopeptidase family serine peptidase [Streptomyces sp. NBC_01306]MCX4727908.1 prolyl oligopeptidase family serine peptidase [Streptomyces sp. NBC_01306]WSX40925.1 prolyl oligopeptidase family serine peptidase [Streptomyces sp. NBC_00963]
MDINGFPRQFARTRRFTLGTPRQFTVSPDGERVLFVRSASGTDARGLLWMYEDGQERLLAGHPAPSGGVTAYAADRDARVVAYAADGELWTVRAESGPERRPDSPPDAPEHASATAAPFRIRTAGPVTDARPSPDGTLIAYVTGGALHVVRTDGTADRLLAAPEDADVGYGLADYCATASIGRSRGYWWSPDSDALLVARVDTSMVRRRYIADPADPEKPPVAIRYPAAGTPNAETSLLVISTGGDRTPLPLPHAVPEGQTPPGAWTAPVFEYLVSASWGSAGPVAVLQTRDQRTVWVVAADPAGGGYEVLSRMSDENWVRFQPGTPPHTPGGVRILPWVRGNVRGIRIGDAISPEGLYVREVVGSVGERVFFTASEEPTEVHVWTYEEGPGFVRLTQDPGVHTAAAGGSTLVVDSMTENGQSVTVRRAGRPDGRIAVLTEEPLVIPAPVHLTLGARELRSRLHLPSWYAPGQERLPVLLSPYAGPGLQVVTRGRGWYTAVCQWYAEQGFAVLATDGRGTPGRGIAWERAIVGDRLGPVLDDQVDALHAAAERYDALDLGRVAIRGWSYSGYLAAGAVLHRPDVFHAAVAGAAPADRRLYDSYWEERFLGHPDVQPEGYERSSLLPHAHRLSRPLMLVHGLADDNVAPAHTLRLSAALLAAGRPHTVLPLSGAGHLVHAEGVADRLLALELDFIQRALARTADAS